MSGGRFGYLYIDMGGPDRLYDTADKLRRMKEYSESAFPDAVPHIDDMLQLIYRFDQEYCEKGAKISHLLKAVEWEASSDFTADQVQDAIDELAEKPSE